MDRSELHELHYITPIKNISSILEHGILCNKKAKKIIHDSVADMNIQYKRAVKQVPRGLYLHEYVNLYINARNPMLYKIRRNYLKIFVLRIISDIIDLPNVIITDGNAASEYTAFFSVTKGLPKIDKDLVYAEWWTDDDAIQKMKKKRIMCSEVLVPYKVDSIFISGAYVACKEAEINLKTIGFSLPIEINSYLFFL